MTINPISAYQAGITKPVDKLPSLSSDGPQGLSFGDFIKEAAGNQVSSLKNFEKAAHASTTGQISELDLISAVNEADLSLQAFKVAWEKFLQKYETIVEKTTL